MARAKTVRLDCVIANKSVYLTPHGLRLGANGKVHEAAEFLDMFSKGNRRRIRKALRKAGFTGLAGTVVQPTIRGAFLGDLREKRLRAGIVP